MFCFSQINFPKITKPWMTRLSQDAAEYSAVLETETDVDKKEHERCIYGVWNLETDELLSLVYCGQIFRKVSNDTSTSTTD